MSVPADVPREPSPYPWKEELDELLAFRCSDLAQFGDWCQKAQDFLTACFDKYPYIKVTQSDNNIFPPLSNAAWELSCHFCPIEVSEKVDPGAQPLGVFPCSRVVQNLRYLADWCKDQRPAVRSPDKEAEPEPPSPIRLMVELLASQQTGDVTKLTFPLAATPNLPIDFLAAFNGAIYMVALADQIQHFCSWNHSAEPRLPTIIKANAQVVKFSVEAINAQYNHARLAILAVTNELTDVRDGPARFGSVVEPNAHLAALNYAGQVEGAVKSAADPVGYSKCFLDPEARTNPAAIVDNYAAVCSHVREMDLPDGKQIVAEVQFEAAKAAERRATRQRSPHGADRLGFDPLTQTVTLDGVTHKITDPKAFAVYQAIADACPLPLTKAQIRGRVPGCRGDKKILELLNTLPKQVRETVRSGVNGYWLDLAPPVQRRKKSRG